MGICAGKTSSANDAALKNISNVLNYPIILPSLTHLSSHRATKIAHQNPFTNWKISRCHKAILFQKIKEDLETSTPLVQP